MLTRNRSKVTPALIAARAKSSPGRIAVSAESEQLTYAQLEVRANQLASYLHSLGAGPGTSVGVCLERCPEFVIVALGIMKSGAAYLPLDPADPAERLCFLAKDAGVELVVTKRNFAEPFGDPQHFPEPDRLILDRKDNKRLAFGWSSHFCFGAPLARMEGQIAFETILRRLANLCLAPAKLRWRENSGLRGLTALPITFSTS